jgi:nitrogen fixation NifU-like protein
VSGEGRGGEGRGGEGRGGEGRGGYGGLQELYGEVILDHNRRPRNFGRLAGANHSAIGHNPLCGDRVTVYLRVEDGRIEGIGFEGVGCAISTASASMMTEALRGKSLAETRQLFERFHALVTGAPAAAREDGAASADAGEAPELGKLAAFAGVGEFPMRVKCATLAWHALQSALAAPAAGSRPGTIP